MLKWLEKYFRFSHRELQGMIVLTIVLLLLWVGPWTYRHWFPGARGNRAVDILEIEQFLAASSKQQAARPATAELFMFDPNGLPVADWQRLGLTDRQIRMIKNYEAKGGRFRENADLGKIYAITDADYARLAPYIRIRKTTRAHTERTQPLRRQVSNVPAKADGAARQSDVPLRIELNATDSLALQALPGIGPVYASRIVRFRDLLGGFHDAAQLLQVYGMDSARYDGLREFISVDTTAVQRIPLNSADYDQLRRHPFIGSGLARLIVRYRKQHGPYRQLSDLFGIAVMDAEIFRRIAPYLKITHD
ncbi:helix-hairpin-helix domain-containing protein [Parapedobacter lycopersici]|uniref:helix-hairpin-helix domain-containing protein n=1 Tax=Parapedobacter lycopersici TaxID=1864939 RepID=UPI00214DA172|nr:helix-hairpin-helix domain-containing protein [Parapedobacter lycopersici]